MAAGQAQKPDAGVASGGTPNVAPVTGQVAKTGGFCNGRCVTCGRRLETYRDAGCLLALPCNQEIERDDP